MRNVMTKAWEIARKGVEKFGGKAIEYISESLRIAWALVKKGGNKMIEMKGSEKQIKWANDVYPKAIENVGNILEEMKEWANKKRGRSMAFPTYFNFFEEMKNIDDAGFWIEHFGYGKNQNDFITGINKYVNKRKEEADIEEAVYLRMNRIKKEDRKRAIKQDELDNINN